MNSTVTRLQSNRFVTLLPVVLLFTYSLAYLVRMVLIVFFAVNPSSLASATRTRVPRAEVIKSVGYYEEIVPGNLIRGLTVDPAKERTIGGEASTGETFDDSEVDPMVVTGTISGDPSFARVTLRDKAGNSEEHAIGDPIGSFRIQAIEQHWIVLRRGKVSFRVLIGESIAQAKEKIREKLEDPSVTALTSSQTIQKVLSREDVNRKLKDPNVIYKDARFGPHLVDGKIEGYKLYQVAKTHIFYSLGARGGDIVKRVNGMPLQDTEKMLEIWGSIKSAPKIAVDIERQGKIITYEFLIRN